MKYMFDTGMIVYLIRHQPKSILERLDALDSADELCMSFFTFSELRRAAEISDSKDQNIKTLKNLIRRIPVVYSTNQDLFQHYELQFSSLSSAQTKVSANRLWIACHAITEKATLVTNNPSELAKVEGLSFQSWGRKNHRSYESKLHPKREEFSQALQAANKLPH
jgi:tRNA(fMet)-specific endonuclease VapC